MKMSASHYNSITRKKKAVTSTPDVTAHSNLPSIIQTQNRCMDNYKNEVLRRASEYVISH